MKLAAVAACVGVAAAPGCARWRVTRVAEPPPVALGATPLTAPRYVPADEAAALIGDPRLADPGKVCVQRVVVATAQPYAERASASRVGDIVGSSVLMGVGALMVVSGLVQDADDGDIDGTSPRDDVFAPAYVFGWLAVVGGALWLGLSHALLPGGPEPPAARGADITRAVLWTEATGCDAGGGAP
ncbi:MAG: hypothetical protein KC635_06615 [Myxococcales bacterium]|nr:hypothetical protein [Myxococcales bacterium]